MKYLSVVMFALILTIFGSCAVPHSKADDRIRVAVIDTGVDYRYIPKSKVCGYYDLTGEGKIDPTKHGTLVSGLILRESHDAPICLVLVKWYSAKNSKERLKDNVIAALKIVLRQHVQYLNISQDGGFNSPEERSLLQQILNQGVVVAVSAGNYGEDESIQCDTFPACYTLKGKFFVVGATNEDGLRWHLSNYGGPIKSWAPGEHQCYKGICQSGTSFSSPNFLGKYIGEVQ